jgi:hypothetical protein
MAKADNPGNGNAALAGQDAADRYHQPRKRSDNDGIATAKLGVTTGSHDATVHRQPPVQGPTDTHWHVNDDPADINEGRFRG